MEPLDMDINVDNGLLAERADWMVLQVQRVLVPLHVPLAGKDLVTDIARKLAALALVNLGNVDA